MTEGAGGGWLARDEEAQLVSSRNVGWGVGDAVAGFLIAQVAAIVVGAAILYALGYTQQGSFDDAPLAHLFLLQIPLWLGYGLYPLWASRTKGNGARLDFGWRFRWLDVPLGLLAGVGTQVVLVPLIYVPIFLIWGERDVSEVARELTDRAVDPLDVVVLLLILVVGAPLIEELFFRGLLLRSLERRLGAGWALAISSVLFGAIHFQLLQFPALAAFGAVVGWLTLRSGRLGPAIWAHIGFNGLTALVLLVD